MTCPYQGNNSLLRAFGATVCDFGELLPVDLRISRLGHGEAYVDTSEARVKQEKTWNLQNS